MVMAESRTLKITVFFTAFLTVLMTVGCASFNPAPLSEVPFFERAQTQTKEGVTVTVAVPTDDESRQLFDTKLHKKGIQAVWMEVINDTDQPMSIMHNILDPLYFSSSEVVYKTRKSYSGKTNRVREDYLVDNHVYPYVAPRSSVTGFSFVNHDEGTKALEVVLLSSGNTVEFEFIVPVPGMKADYIEVDFDELYPKDEYVDLDLDGLREFLELLPHTVTNKKKTGEGDPLNLVMIGDFEDLVAAFTRSGWDETHRVYLGSAWKSAKSFVFGGRYRYQPISDLYVFGRPQDMAIQKARESVHERNHAQFWVTKKKYKGKSVWIGQISRDIGVKWTLKTGILTTHKIDPYVDADRWFLIQDLIKSQRVYAMGYVKGVEEHTRDDPGYNFGGDPWYTDGLRVVLFVSDESVAYDELRFLDWENLPAFELFKTKWLLKNEN